MPPSWWGPRFWTRAGGDFCHSGLSKVPTCVKAILRCTGQVHTKMAFCGGRRPGVRSLRRRRQTVLVWCDDVPFQNSNSHSDGNHSKANKLMPKQRMRHKARAGIWAIVGHLRDASQKHLHGRWKVTGSSWGSPRGVPEGFEVRYGVLELGRSGEIWLESRWPPKQPCSELIGIVRCLVWNLLGALSELGQT
jgi:hypothetical protein